MKIAAAPENESERLAELKKYFLLDTPAEEAIDQLVRLAAKLCDTPIALVSLVDQDRQWFKSRIGLEATETPRELAFCAHAILKPEETLIVEDTLKDDRFFDNPLVLNDPNIRFYAGAPLKTISGAALGTLCVIDRVPKKLTALQIETLEVLSRQVMFQLELRHVLKFSFELLQDLDKSKLDKEVIIEDLQDSNMLLEQYASLAAHDIKEPLRAISCFSTLIANKFSKALGLEGLSYLNKLTEAAIRIQKMIDEILEYSKLKSELQQNEEVAVEESIKTVIDNLTFVIKDTNATVTYDQMPTVKSNTGHLTRVLQNLISNGLKYTKKDSAPQVSISVDEIGNFWRVAVVDNGIGIEKKDLSRVFEPFVRLHSDKRIQGTGLGLAACKNLVENWGGEIWASSNEGEGSTFFFTIPR